MSSCVRQNTDYISVANEKKIYELKIIVKSYYFEDVTYTKLIEILPFTLTSVTASLLINEYATKDFDDKLPVHNTRIAFDAVGFFIIRKSFNQNNVVIIFTYFKQAGNILFVNDNLILFTNNRITLPDLKYNDKFVLTGQNYNSHAKIVLKVTNSPVKTISTL